MRSQRNRFTRPKRRGAVAVEFAMIAPFLMATIVGLLELTRVYDVQNMLETAAREGARLAAMDRGDLLQPGQTSNTKLIQDVKNYLASMGIPPGDISVTIVDAENPSQPFDLDDPANELQLFKTHVCVPFSSVSFTPVSNSKDYTLSASITFRNGRAILTQ